MILYKNRVQLRNLQKLNLIYQIIQDMKLSTQYSSLLNKIKGLLIILLLKTIKFLLIKEK